MSRNLIRYSWFSSSFLVLALLSASLGVPDSRADSISYNISTDACGPIPSFVFVTVTLNLSAPARYVRMSAPYLCGIPVTWNYPVSGPASDLTVDLGGCVSGSVDLYSAVGFGSNCCPSYCRGPVSNISDESPPVLIGCDDQPRYVMPPCSTGVPQLVSPADGTLVTQTPTLSWSHSLGTRCGGLAGVVAFRLYYGTDPANLDHLIRTEEERSRTLPVLAPNTRYFWRVFVDDGAGLYTGSQGAVSEVHSFYTSGPVATTPVTWGKVKSMYRD